MALFDDFGIASTPDCRGPDWTIFIHSSLIPALLIVLILSFFGKRYNFRLRSLFGIKQLAVILPINLLDDHDHRWSHALAFGATASVILTLFSGGYTNLYLPDETEVVETWLKILLGAIATFEVGTVLFPFFACITSPNLFIGSLLGFMYVAVWFSVLLSTMVLCPNLDAGQGFPYESVVLQLPVLVFTFLLMLRFLYYLVVSIIRRVKGVKLTSDEKLMKSYQAQHVMTLLRPPQPEREYTKRWEQIAYKWYTPADTFVYPTRIICTFTVAILCQYEISIGLTYSFDQFINRVADSLREYYGVYVISYNITPAEADETYLAITRYESAAHVSWYLAAALSIITSLTYIGHIFVCYRKHILRLYQGNRRFLPDIKLTSTQNMTGSLQYCGFQIAYYLSGYVIMTMTMFLVMYVISGAIIIPLMKNAVEFILSFINVMVPLLAVAMLVFGSQPFLARRVFLQPRIHPTDVDKPLALQHRDFYHTFSYFLVFLNVLVGMLSCVIRILTGLVVGVFLLCRIDRPILMRGFENLDQSYLAYIGNLNMINAHSHPVLVVFCQILINKIVVRKKARLRHANSGPEDESATYEIIEHDIGRSKTYAVVGYGSTNNRSSTLGKSISPHARAVMRWQLAYTLLFNPSLLHTRKRSRQITFKEMEERILKVATLLPHRQQVLQRSQAAVARGPRVQSAPLLYAEREMANKLAAAALNRELMDDMSDHGEEMTDEDAHHFDKAKLVVDAEKDKPVNVHQAKDDKGIALKVSNDKDTGAPKEGTFTSAGHGSERKVKIDVKNVENSVISVPTTGADRTSSHSRHSDVTSVSDVVAAPTDNEVVLSDDPTGNRRSGDEPSLVDVHEENGIHVRIEETSESTTDDPIDTIPTQK
ncbi:stimulated by retinoic acid gene 6 protein-like [Diadema setosum]|uniref:stimulated by retinoic acid gene 6 protein-like n=1 Tax=Diadema setosum TaxID=31175 RepID=UPI003B3B7A57